MPPGTIPADHGEGWLTRTVAANLPGPGEGSRIEVFQADELLGIGLGSDILVVDDDPDNLTAYEAALAPLGRRVTLVRSGMQALARLLEQDFALLLLDVSMPDMNGLETARRIRQRARNRGLPILFITGVTSSTDVVLEAYEVGAFDFLMKPIPPAVLRAKARVYLQLQERTYELLRESAQLRDAHARLGEADQKLRERDASALALRSAQDENRRKDEFLGMLSHELRNPLWTVVNALELLKMRDSPLGRELAIIERQVEHLTHIVGDLLDFSRLTRGKITLRRETVELASVVANAIDTARPLIEQRAHQVTVQVPDGLAVDADRHRLQQVIENLLANAVKYTAERGLIAISAEPDGRFARIAVRDNGRGIPAALLRRLFQPFVQGEQALDRSEGGLGIGLTLVETLIELHGGRIEAHSEGPGTGATFTVRWPIASPSPAIEQAPAAAAAMAARRILIVDDNAEAADMLGALLRIAGHEVALAHDGPAALEVARDFAPHLALLDLGLPVMDGYELARRLRLLEACSATLLVALSGYGQPDDRQRSAAAGFAHHLVKPVKLATLEALFARTATRDR
jgi:signal transduction histidine kinase